MIPARHCAVLAVALLLAPAALPAATQPIDLATTLRLAGADNLSVKIAREKLTEARAEAAVANSRMLPWVSTGFAFRQHENNIQAVDGTLLNADKRSFAAGFGLNAQWDFGDVYFQKLAAQQRARAEEAAFATQRQTTVYEAALAYFELLRATATIGIATDALALSQRYLDQIQATASAGITFAGDVQRVATQRARNETAVQQAREQARIAAARLAEILKLDPTVDLTPLESELVPVTLTDPAVDLGSLVAGALAARPELTQAEARVAALRETHRGTRYGPLIPVVGAQANVGGLGGESGLRSWSRGFDTSADYSLGLSWRIGPGGLLDRGELETEQTRDQIRRQVVEFYAHSKSLGEQLTSLRTAMEAAEKTAQLSRERRAQSVSGVLEDLVAEEELTRARRDYVGAIAQFDQAQYALVRALGGEPASK